jgi:hypothetical protein
VPSVCGLPTHNMRTCPNASRFGMVPPEFAVESADARHQREQYNLMGTSSAAPARAAMIAMSTQQSAAAHVEISTAAGMIRVKVPGNILDEPKAEEPTAQPARRSLIRSLTHAWSLGPEEEGSVAHRVREIGQAFVSILSGRVPDPLSERPRTHGPKGSLSGGNPRGASPETSPMRRPSVGTDGRRRRPSGEASSNGSGRRRRLPLA